jgi:DNA repair protein RadC
MLGVKEIMYEAIADRAESIILCHNHPTGDPKPSEADEQATRQVSQACDVLGIRLLDHIVIGEKLVVSFADAGKIPNCKVSPKDSTFIKKGVSNGRKE